MLYMCRSTFGRCLVIVVDSMSAMHSHQKYSPHRARQPTFSLGKRPFLAQPHIPEAHWGPQRAWRECGGPQSVEQFGARRCTSRLCCECEQQRVEAQQYRAHAGLGFKRIWIHLGPLLTLSTLQVLAECVEFYLRGLWYYHALVWLPAIYQTGEISDPFPERGSGRVQAKHNVQAISYMRREESHAPRLGRGANRD